MDPTTKTGSGVQAAMEELATFPLVEALFGRRSRRFALGDEIPGGPQAYHLDLDFYDRFFKPGAHLRTHAEHMDRWH